MSRGAHRGTISRNFPVLPVQPGEPDLNVGVSCREKSRIGYQSGELALSDYYHSAFHTTEGATTTVCDLPTHKVSDRLSVSYGNTSSLLNTKYSTAIRR